MNCDDTTICDFFELHEGREKAVREEPTAEITLANVRALLLESIENANQE